MRVRDYGSRDLGSSPGGGTKPWAADQHWTLRRSGSQFDSGSRFHAGVAQRKSACSVSTKRESDSLHRLHALDAKRSRPSVPNRRSREFDSPRGFYFHRLWHIYRSGESAWRVNRTGSRTSLLTSVRRKAWFSSSQPSARDEEAVRVAATVLKTARVYGAWGSCPPSSAGETARYRKTELSVAELPPARAEETTSPHLDSEPDRAPGSPRKRNEGNALSFEYSAIRRALQQTSPSRPVHGVAVRALHSPTRVGQRCGVWNGGRKTTSGHTGQVQLLPGELGKAKP
jgi:hypothetical protein